MAVVRREALGLGLTVLSSIHDTLEFAVAVCSVARDRLSDLYAIETDAHRHARERLTGAH